MVARNTNGSVLASKAIIHTNVSNTFAAEALACTEAIKIGLDLGLNRVLMEDDSLTVIKKCQNKNKDKSEIGPFIQNIQALSQLYALIKFQYTKRIGNNLADKIEKESLRRGEEFYLLEDVSNYAKEIQRDEAIREPD